MSARWTSAFLLVIAFSALAKPPDAPTIRQHRLEAASRMFATADARWKAGTGSIEDVYVWSQRWAEAAAAKGDPEAAVAHRARMDAVVAEVGRRVEAGTAVAEELTAATYYADDAWLDARAQ
jgi:hypothetical protein